MLNSVKANIVTGALFFLGAAISAPADTFTFDFPGLSAGNNSAAIATYMDGIIGCTNCVTVTGAVVDSTYTADGHVTGPGTGNNAGTTSLTLGNSNGATASNTNSTIGSAENFIANTDNNGNNIASQISIKFNGYAITGVSFDYEIFPDINCTALTSSSCGGAKQNGFYPNQPSLELMAGNGTGDTAVTAFGSYGTGFQWGVTPGTTNGNAVNSPTSGPHSAETAPQYIGTSGALTLNSVSQLDFVDWPATIGIDNLVITMSTNGNTGSTVPEPSSIILLATIGLGCFLVERKRQKA